jgi:hypothetical protein
MTTVRRGPAWAEGWLRRFTDPETAEAIVGDILEALGDKAGQWRTVPAGRLVLEVLSATWLLLVDRWARPPQTYGGSDMDSWSPTWRRVAALLGLAACIPALILVAGGLLQVFFGTSQMLRILDQTVHNQDLAVVRILRHPATILGGLLIAGALNLLPLLRLGLSHRDGTVVGTVIVRTRASHLAVAALAGVLLCVLLGYGFTENFIIEPRPPAVALSPCPPDTYTSAELAWRSTPVRLLVLDESGRSSTTWPTVLTLQPACAETSP